MAGMGHARRRPLLELCTEGIFIEHTQAGPISWFIQVKPRKALRVGFRITARLLYNLRLSCGRGVVTDACWRSSSNGRFT